MIETRVGEIGVDQLHHLLRDGEFGLLTGSLTTRIRSRFRDVAEAIHVLYAEHPFVVRPDFADFHVWLRAPANLRRWMRRQAEFTIEGDNPFEPLPRDQAPALLEWGLNWSISSYCNQWLMIHAASLERNGRAVILPAPPGSGKSTLCAALAFRGWRLLSDELTLLDPGALDLHALARPISMKNASIEIIRAFEPTAGWSAQTYDTNKGRVAYLRPPAESVRRMREPASPRWVVFPRYVPGAEPLLTPRAKTTTFIELAGNAFNYGVLGEAGFLAVAGLMDRCDCFDFVYSRLEDALEVFEWIESGGDGADLEPEPGKSGCSQAVC